MMAQIERLLNWIPLWLVSVTALVLAALAAWIAHSVIVRACRRYCAQRQFLAMLMARTYGPMRLALVMFALNLTVEAVPGDPQVTATLAHALRVGLVALLGWIALIAIRIGADLYLRRFHLDQTDNLLARKHVTQVRILERTADTLVVVITLAAALMTFDSVRQYGVSLFASAGAAGLVLGFAARPVLSNLIAGVQIAITQPIRIDDAVIVENEWGNVEEITSTYVVIRIWDWRRLIVPLNYFIEKPFQNWTRESAELIGSVMLHVDYTMPIDRIRAAANEIAAQSKLWDRKVVNVQVVDAKEQTVQVRVLVSAATAPAAWDLRCEVREKLIAYLQKEYPHALPRQRSEVSATLTDGGAPDLAPRQSPSG